MHFARLLHLVDSAIPTGSFAYSYGLESSISLGLIRDDAGLRNYLYAYLQQAASLEIPFLNSCFHPNTNRAEMAAEYDAQLLVPALHRASAVQGRTWLKLLADFYPEASTEQVGNWFEDQQLPPHFTLVFAMALQRAGYPLADVQTMYLHMLLRDQLSAAIRLGFLGPLAGHRLQHDFYAVFEHLLAGQEGRGFGEAHRSAFMLDVAQVLHEDMYSRLFQN
ncbi:urease accessory protein UreF [Hymenobacter sp. IS2118]|uniref:urease accessory protein UreF n=1 Tax=Hymenobacter sp. IS2118 TaxID=1505605 RepID=UPI000551EDEA|nr:urease accessory UreF family protein [Hymenobacter sp. IS2118]